MYFLKERGFWFWMMIKWILRESWIWMGLDWMFSFCNVLVDFSNFPLSLSVFFFRIRNYCSISTINFIHGFNLLSFIFTDSWWGLILLFLRIKFKKSYFSRLTELKNKLKNTYLRFLFNAHMSKPFNSVSLMSVSLKLMSS